MPSGKLKRILRISSESSKTITSKVRQKIFSAIVLGVLHFYRYTESFRFVRGMKRRSTFKTFALEFIIFMVVIVSAYIYQDPNTNTLQYPLNLLLFLAVLAIPAYFYIKEKFLQ